ncbi:MAG: bifunctional diguanylate cyclase/phosphodiesterase [Treponema sp.]|nr:bifunctional diguanylate cyclase/phosphodiesterase [Treponema sp.]
MHLESGGYEKKSAPLLCLLISLSSFCVCASFFITFVLPDTPLYISRFVFLLVSVIVQLELIFNFLLKGYLVQTCIATIQIIIAGILFYLGKSGTLVVPFIKWGLSSIGIGFLLFAHLKRMNDSYKGVNRIAFSDDLTGLMNRKKIISGISNLINKEEPFFIMFVDMDNFKMINDSLGHQVGNIFLNEVVHNIQCVIKPWMWFGRMGGDEFMIVSPKSMNREEIVDFVDKVEKHVSLPFMYKNRSYIVTCSIGISEYPLDAHTTLELLRKADLALYRAKSYGKKRAVFYDENIQHDFDHKLMMESKLHQAIDNNELFLEFQAQYSSAEGTIKSYETLLRWQSEDFGLVSPSKFIPIAEENGDILQIGQWVLNNAFDWFMKGKNSKKIAKDVLLSVNISVVQFSNPLFIEELKNTFAQTGMQPMWLIIEVTEYACVYSPETTAQRIKELAQMGVKVALDDFGVGYASISYLRLLPFSIVKIDRSIVATILNAEKECIVSSIIQLAHALNLLVVAEGIETEEQYTYLKQCNCDCLQGFYLSKPEKMIV